MGYIAQAPLVVAKDKKGAHVYVYAGQPVPDNVAKDEVARLAEEGFIVKDGDAVDIPEGEPNGDWTVKQLQTFAANGGIDLGAASKKDEILAVLAK